MKNFILLTTCLVLAGCATAPPANNDDPEVFGRIDCQRAADRPDIQAQYEQATAICRGRAEAAAISGTSAMPQGGYGFADGLANSLNRNTAQGQIARSTIISCMAEQGYLYKRKSEHESMCAAIAARNKTEQVSNKNSSIKKRQN